MIVLHPCALLPSCTTITCFKPFSHNNRFVPSSMVPRLALSYARTRTFSCSARNRLKDLNGRDFSIDIVNENLELEDDGGDDGFSARGLYARSEANDTDEEEAQKDGDGGYSGSPGKDYDRDPELGNILGSFLENPQEAQSKLEDRLRKKRSKILHTKTGSGKPMKVSFNKWKRVVGPLAVSPASHYTQFCDGFGAGKNQNRWHRWWIALTSSIWKNRNLLIFQGKRFEQPKVMEDALFLMWSWLKSRFDFSNSYIWFEFYNVPLAKDVSLICNTIRAWHIIGRLGGCNAMNMQLSQSPMDARPSYDYIQGANVEPTTFYNIGDLEVQDNLARIWVDIGTVEPLLLNVLINALTQISSDFVGIKQVMFGGSEFENWNENLKSEDAGYGVHKI